VWGLDADTDGIRFVLEDGESRRVVTISSVKSTDCGDL